MSHASVMKMSTRAAVIAKPDWTEGTTLNLTHKVVVKVSVHHNMDISIGLLTTQQLASPQSE